MKAILTICFLAFYHIVTASHLDSSADIGTNSWSIKANLIDVSFFSSVHSSIALEKTFQKEELIGIELQFGYVFYDVDALEPTKGFRLEQNFHFYLRNKSKKTSSSFGTGFLYHKTTTNLPILFAKQNGTFLYKEYEYADVKKTRFGTYLQYKLNINISKRFYLDNLFGLGITHYSHSKPKNSIQEDIQNGLFYTNNQLLPNWFTKIRMAYRF